MQKIEENLRNLRIALFLGLLPAAILVGCNQSSTATSQATRMQPVLSCEGGYLRASLTGAITTDVNWSSDEMSCDSMLRPQGEGIRLQFAGLVGDERLSIILAMPDLIPDAVDVEVPSNVTVTVENSGRFFSTPGLASCWTDVRAQERLPDNANRYFVAGVLYCVAPLGELNGDAAVSIAELSFGSTLDWSEN